LIAGMVVAGTASYTQLGVDRFPRMDLPTVYVRATYRGAAPQEIESEITQRLEDAVATVEGIDELRSISSDGSSLLLLTFNINRDIDAATQDVRDAVSSVYSRLPPGTDPPVIRKQDVDASPVLSLAVAGQRDRRELYVLADRDVKNIIESARGVGQVSIAGATERAVQIQIEAKRLAAYGLSILQVREALERQNAEIPGGRVDAGIRELNLRTLGRFTDPRSFADLVVATVNGAPVRLRDLGTALDTTKEERSLARLNGRPAVVLEIQRQSGANTVDVIRAVKERLERCRELLPNDVTLEILRDQSRYINAALHEIQKHLVAGGILASIVVLFFMRSWRSTLIAAVAIPTSLIATFAMMRAMDFTLNNVTMLALVLMVGVVIDDAIVVLENIFHWIEERGVAPMQAAIIGTKEIGLAVLAITTSLVVVFLPVSFISSVAGRMLFEFGLTATVAILVSMVVSFSLTPMMCSRMLKPVRAATGVAASRRGMYRWIEAGYTVCLRASMRFRWLVLALSLAVIASNVPLYHMVSKDYIPTNVDEGEFEVSVTAPEGATLRTMQATLETVEVELNQVQGITTLLSTIGSSGLSRLNSASIYVRLADMDKRVFSLGRLWRETWAGQPRAAFEGNFSQRSKMQEIRQRLSQYPDLRCSVRNQTSLRQGAPVDIDFAITGPDLEQLAIYTETLRRRFVPPTGADQAPSGEKNGPDHAAKSPPYLPGLVDTDTTLRLNKPELLVEIDRQRTADLGVDVAEIAQTLRVAIGGDDRVSRYRDPSLDDVYDVELRLVGFDRKSKEDISQLYVRARSTQGRRAAGEQDPASNTFTTAGFTRLDNVVHFRTVASAARIDRLDRQRMASFRANIAPEFALGDRIDAVRQAAAELNMPAAYSTRVMGRGRELERTLRDFAWMFVLAFIFMYIILAAQFEHLVHPLTILFSLPLAVPFGLFSLWLGGESLNLYSALGILVLFGMIKKASILQVDHTNQLRATGMARLDAILQANRDRLRPILMTTISFVAGMLPLLIATGPGAEERRSIAVLAVGGQTLSLLLTLVAVPVVYSILDDLGVPFRRSAHVPQPADPPADATDVQRVA
ncbi:MAG: efflux RND transporter permease subunit, partial [Planctomycetes bacterium]|nr:efflux RND transporter permease subunit [Planctomycetota bacterium]